LNAKLIYFKIYLQGAVIVLPVIWSVLVTGTLSKMTLPFEG